MDPETLLNQLCERHGGSRNEGYRLLPLVRWALRGPDDTREKILAVVEQTLAMRAGNHENDGTLELAADRATSDDLTRIEAAFLRMEKAVDDYDSSYFADVDFHLAVLNASHNRPFQRLVGIIDTVLGLSFGPQKQARIPLQESLGSHYDVFDGNRRAAERAMRVTIRRGRDTLSQQRTIIRGQTR